MTLRDTCLLFSYFQLTAPTNRQVEALLCSLSQTAIMVTLMCISYFLKMFSINWEFTISGIFVLSACLSHPVVWELKFLLVCYFWFVSIIFKMILISHKFELFLEPFSFNPVAHTSLVKTLNRIASLESQQVHFSTVYSVRFWSRVFTTEEVLILKITFRDLLVQNKSTFLPPSKETIDLLAQNSGGDIRTAINGLQFSCLKGERKLYYNIII